MELPYDEQQLLDILSQALKDAAPEVRAGWYAEFSDETGIGEEAIKKWLYGQNAPGLYHFLAAIAFLGADFGNKLFAGTGYKLVPLGSDEIDKAHLSELLSETLDALDSSNSALRTVAEEIRKQKLPDGSRKQKLPRGSVALRDKKPKAVA